MAKRDWRDNVPWAEAKAAGLPTFQTRIRCEGGHLGKRYIANNHCVECSRLYQRGKKRQRDPEQQRQATQRYFSKPENRKRHLIFTNRRRVKKYKNGGSHTYDEIVSLGERQGWKCANPRCSMLIAQRYEADHIMPIKLGGSDDIENIQLLCPPCNRRKSAVVS